MASTTLLVANPTAQSGKNADRIEQARALLVASGVDHEFRATEPEGGTVTLVSKALQLEGHALVIYMGGDGTFAEVAKGILHSGRAADVRMGMLPTGTANDQGKSFGLESAADQLERNVRVIAEGREAWLDAGRVRGFDAGGKLVKDDHFFDSAGWGISPRVLQLRNEDRKVIDGIPLVRDLWRDQLVYVGALFRTFLESYVEDDKFDVTVVADGRTVEWIGLSDLILKGTRVYGGMWVFDPTSRCDDGMFEVVPFLGKRDWVSKAIVSLDESGTTADGLAAIGVTHSEGFSAAHIELSFHPHTGALPVVAQLDGEEWKDPTPRVVVDVLPRALRLVVPAEFASA